MRKSVLLLTAFLIFSIYLFAQNSMTGDGFGGRVWYKAHNYQVGSYSAYTVCGLDSQLYGWGNNSQGELGNGSASVSTGYPVAAIGMTSVKFYASGYISGAIKSDNTGWVWGGATYGAPSFGFTATPHQVLSDVKFIDGGSTHVVFVKNDGSVWGAGYNILGQLGNGTQNDTIKIPVQMVGITNAVRAIAVRLGTVVLLRDGTVKLCGGGGIFQPVNSISPVAMPGLNNIIDIKGNAYGAFALNSSGEVFAFGSDSVHLGLGNSYNQTTVAPAKLNFPVGAAPTVALSANDDGGCAMALDANGNVYGWGETGSGQLGIVGEANFPTLTATGAVDIFAGETFSYILKADGTLWATGSSLNNSTGGNIWMNLPNIQRNAFTQINPTLPPMNLCAPKVWGVVPIKLSSFTCVVNDNKAVLNWQSAEETNAGEYIVQYSNDGNRFKDIATVFATGSNSKYHYTHQQVSGTAFYKLKMMDKDGSFKFSEIRVVKFDAKAGFTIAPNPANDVVHFFTKNNAVIKSIQILTVDGQVIKTLSKYNSGQQISISNLAIGTYILKAFYKNNEMEYARFIKM